MLPRFLLPAWGEVLFSSLRVDEKSPPPRAGKKSSMLPSFPRRLRRGEGDKTKTMAKKLPPREVLIRGVVPWFFGRLKPWYRPVAGKPCIGLLVDWYVDVILQLIDKAGDFVSDDIWYRVVQFVTNNEDLQVSAYLLGEYSHLLARRPGCSPKEIFAIINEKLPTVAYESYIDVEIQQRAVEYFSLSRKGAALVDVLAEMPKFPERQSALLKKAEDAEVDTAEQSAIKIRSQQQTSNALVVTDQRPANGSMPVSQLGLVRMPSQNMEAGTQGQASSREQGMTDENGSINKVVPQDTPSADLLGDLLGPLAIEGPPVPTVPVEQKDKNLLSALEATSEEAGPLALATVDDQPNSVQVQCPLEVVNIRASRDLAVLDFSYKFVTAVVIFSPCLSAFLGMGSGWGVLYPSSPHNRQVITNASHPCLIRGGTPNWEMECAFYSYSWDLICYLDGVPMGTTHIHGYN
ncbi:hypothetical protein BHE74_00019187 [Ensete ventricosum]|nr:hypothetical protein BHE74_00019187 [Ensete ventricosum]